MLQMEVTLKRNPGTDAYPLKAISDKQFHCDFINVVSLVFIITLSITFDNKQERAVVIFSPLNPRHLSVSLIIVLRLCHPPASSFPMC